MTDKDKIYEILKKLGLEELKDTRYMDKVQIIQGETGFVAELYGYNEGDAWYIIEGSIKIISYLEDGREFYWELVEGDCLGIADAILGTYAEYDIEIFKDVVVLQLPLRDIVEGGEVSMDTMRSILHMVARSSKHTGKIAFSRMGYSDELFFLKHLERNDYILTFKNLKGLSELLNINLRTFQRLLKKLVQKDIIFKERGCIKVADLTKYQEYLKELSE